MGTLSPLPPGPRAPAVVNPARLMTRPIESLLGWHRRYGDVVTVPLLIFGTGVYVADVDAIREMFTGDQSDLHAGEANAPLAAVLGERSLLVLDGPEHLRQRRLLLPPLKGSAVHESRAVIREVAEAEAARWRVGERFAVRERTRALTFEVIARIVFGVTEAARIERLHRVLTAVLDATVLLALPELLRRDLGRWSPWGRLRRLLERADALIYEEIAQRRRQSDRAERGDVLSLLLQTRDEDGRPMTDRELRDELMTMLLAGHETTATSLAFTFDLLLHTPTVLARLTDEPDDGAYVGAVVTESLRLRPVIDAAERTAPRTIAGHALPAGIRVYPNIVAMHYREDLYPEAAAFRPDRFLDGRAGTCAWLPFGGGIRRCIGAPLAEAEIAEVTRVVLSRVRLRAVQPAPDRVVMRGITLVPRHGVEVEVVAQAARAAGTPAARARSAGMSRSTHSPEAAVSPATMPVAPP